MALLMCVGHAERSRAGRTAAHLSRCSFGLDANQAGLRFRAKVSRQVHRNAMAPSESSRASARQMSSWNAAKVSWR